MPTQVPPILRLPLELRQLIYAHLLPEKLTSRPLPIVGFTQVTHPPPSSALLNIHRQLTDEILDYYYSITTWTLIFSHAFNFFRIDPGLRGLERSYILHRIQRLECLVFCDALLLKDNTTDTVESFCAALRPRIKRAADVLMSAENLRSITVSWLDSTSCYSDAALEAKASILAPLRQLEGKATPVKFGFGRINGVGSDRDVKMFVEFARGVLGEGQGVRRAPADGGSDPTAQVAAGLGRKKVDSRLLLDLGFGRPAVHPVFRCGR